MCAPAKLRCQIRPGWPSPPIAPLSAASQLGTTVASSSGVAPRYSPSSTMMSSFSPRSLSRVTTGESVSPPSTTDSGSSSDRSSGSTQSNPNSRAAMPKSQSHPSHPTKGRHPHGGLAQQRRQDHTRRAPFPAAYSSNLSSFATSLSPLPSASTSSHPAIGSSAHSSASPLTPSSSSSSPSHTPTLQLQRCSTLFVTNLSMLASEQDLLALFEPLLGFHRLLFQLNAEGAPIAFIDFESEEHSSSARSQLQGILLHHAPLRIEFAKQKMKRPRRRADQR